MNPAEDFETRNQDFVSRMAADERLGRLTREWFNAANAFEYSYHFAWLSRPIIQYPQDVLAMQELIWKVQPDLIVETGIAHGGSLIMSASMLALLDYCEASREGKALEPRASRRKVIAVDIDIRAHNREAIEAHPLAHKIEMLQGSSVDPNIVDEVRSRARGYKRILVSLDSNHTHDHVLQELEAYAPLTSAGSYCVVFDTVIEDLPEETFPNRPWARGDNPKTAVVEYLRRLDAEGRQAADGSALRFEVDTAVENKLLITVAPNGYLRRV